MRNFYNICFAYGFKSVFPQAEHFDRLFGNFFFTGLLFVGLAIPLILKKIGPNQLYGWRTPKAFSSDEIWYEINRYSGRDMLVLGVVQIIFNIGLLIFADSLGNLMYWLLVPGNLLILVGGTAVMMIRGVLYLRKL